MQAITTVGLDIAKSVFQVHGVDAAGKVIVRRQLKRRHVLPFFQRLPACVVGMEACATSHHWSRELRALGHTVRLMPPAYVKPYVKRQKNDAADAEAICEAVTRANMRFVETKAPEQQACLMLHRTRHLFIRQQTSVINAIRAHMAEFGIVARVGRNGVAELLEVAADPTDRRLPEAARTCVAALGVQLRMLKAQILEFDRRIGAWHRSSQTSKRLDQIPGIGPALATALVASVPDPKAFRSGRNFSAWIGLVPKQHSSGGKDRFGSLSKQGDRYLRGLFTAGALAVIRYAKVHGTEHRPWLTALLARRPTKVAAIALANKLARIAWAIMAKGERYKEPAALAA
jgi:transposase